MEHRLQVQEIHISDILPMELSTLIILRVVVSPKVSKFGLVLLQFSRAESVTNVIDVVQG